MRSILLLAASLLATAASAQQIPKAMSQCEYGRCDGTWTFTGQQGEATWRDGSRGHLTVTHIDATSIDVERRDTEGLRAGMAATYHGTLTGNHYEGKYTWWWTDHPEKGRHVSDWSADITVPAGEQVNGGAKLPQITSMPATSGQPSSNPYGLPDALRLCNSDDEITFCGTLTWGGKKYRGLMDSAGTILDITIDRFEGGDIAFTTVDGYTPATTGKFTGKMDAHGIGEGKTVFSKSGESAPYTWKIFPKSLATQRYDLNGIWQKPEDGHGPEPLIRVTQVGNDLQIGYQSEVGHFGPFFFGFYTDNPVILGKNHRVDSAGKDMYVIQNYFVDDPDHIHNTKVPLVRITQPGPYDAPCDANNVARVDDQHAFLRGQSALGLKTPDLTMAVCWLSIGVAHNHPGAEAALALLLDEGKGIAQDRVRAFAMAQKSADQGNATGEMLLSDMYKQGHGTPPNAERAAFWLAKGQKQVSDEQWALWNTKNAMGASPMDFLESILGVVSGATSSSESDDRDRGGYTVCGNTAGSCYYIRK